jgi:hypothetical protein
MRDRTLTAIPTMGSPASSVTVPGGKFPERDVIAEASASASATDCGPSGAAGRGHRRHTRVWLR